MANELSPLLVPSPTSTESPPTAKPHPNSCFSCTPPYGHPRVWIPDPADPTSRNAKTLVLCFDGTGDSFDEDNSNVVQFLSMLKKDRAADQRVYYQAGIGTYTSPVLKTPLVAGVSKVLDEMVAWNIDEHIKDGYRFIMQNYTEGAKICIFGFSRGAFTARALAGMLQKVGLLPTYNTEQIPFAWTMYKRDDDEGFRLSAAFKRTFSIDVRIEFLGVWDTVASVGLVPHHLPFSGSNNAIVHFRHALALDEHRVKFAPSFCTGGKSKDVKTKEQEWRKKHHKEQHSGSAATFETVVNEATGIETDVLEVFFAGAHCDVGGGSVPNATRHSLARIPLRWMIRECFRTGTGIIFDAHMLQHEVGMDIDNLYFPPPRLSPKGKELKLDTEKRQHGIVNFVKIMWSTATLPATWLATHLRNLVVHSGPTPVFVSPESRFESKGEAVEELEDALCPVYDQLNMHFYWKVMEWLPMITKKTMAEIDGSDNFWAYQLTWNRGEGRKVYWPVMRRGLKVHRSVKTRMEALGTEGSSADTYLPRIRPFVKGKPKRFTVDEWLAENPQHFEWVE